MATLSISQYYKKGRISREDDATTVENPTDNTDELATGGTDAELAKVDAQVEPGKAPAAADPEVVEAVDNGSTDVQFDTADTTPTEEVDVDPNEAANTAEEYSEVVSECDDAIAQQTEIAEVNEELQEEVPVLENRLEEASSADSSEGTPAEPISETEAMIVTESLKYKLKRLGIPLNNSKAVSSVSQESLLKTPSLAFQIALEDEKTLLQKTGEAMKKTWEWVKAQFMKIVDLVKKLFANLKQRAQNMIVKLNEQKDQPYKAEADVREAAAKAAPVIWNGEIKLKDINDFNMESLKEANDMIKLLIGSKLDENIVTSYAAKLDQKANSKGLPKTIKDYDNKDFKYKSIIATDTKNFLVFLLNVKEDDTLGDYKMVTVPAIEPNDGGKLKSPLKCGEIANKLQECVDAMDVANKNYEELKNVIKSVKIENKEDSAILTPVYAIVNKMVNHSIVKAASMSVNAVNNITKSYMILGTDALKGKAEDKKDKAS